MNKMEKMDGKHAWMVLTVAFVGQAMSVGFYFCFGPIYVEIIKLYDATPSEAAWVGSIGYSSCFLFGIISSLICDRLSCGYALSMGGGFVGLGMLLSSFAPNTLTLFVTYGIVTSIGTSLLFFSSLLVLPLYFKKRLGSANGIASSGSGVGGITLAPIFALLIKKYGLPTTFQVYAIFSLLPIIGGFLIRRKSNVTETVKKEESVIAKLSSCFDRKLLTNKAFLLYTAAMSTILFAYYIPYVHLINFSCLNGIHSEHAALLPSIISASGVIGKLLFGYISQLRRVNRLYMFQGFLLFLSISLTMLPLATNYIALAAFSVVFGLSEGGFSAYIIIVTSQVVSTSQLASAFGMMYTVTSFFSLLGPPFAAYLFTATGSYETAFFACGAILMCGALSLFFIPYFIPGDVFDEKVKLKELIKYNTESVDHFNAEEKMEIIVKINIDDENMDSVPLIGTPTLTRSNLHSLQNISIFGSHRSMFGSHRSILGIRNTLENIVNKYLILSDMTKTSSLRSLVSIPPFAPQDYINKYNEQDEPVNV